MAYRQLQLVIKLSRERRDTAAQVLANAQANLDSALGQLAQLQQYQEDYERQALSAAGSGISAQKLLTARQFVGQLDSVIATQRNTVGTREDDVERCRRNWLEITRYTSAVEKLLTLKLKEQQVSLNKREQQLIEDIYNQRHF